MFLTKKGCNFIGINVRFYVDKIKLPQAKDDGGKKKEEEISKKMNCMIMVDDKLNINQ